jgi:hypothetical protein
LPKVAQVFCGFRALKSTLEAWNEDRGEYGYDGDYNHHLDEGEGVPNMRRGTFGHGILGLAADHIAVQPRAKAKRHR